MCELKQGNPISFKEAEFVEIPIHSRESIHEIESESFRRKIRELYEEEHTTHIPLWKFWKRRRYVVALLGFFGFFNIYSLRVNMSIAVVAMVANVSRTLPNGTVVYEQEFDWDSTTRGLVLSAFFYGYITTQLLGGWIAAKIGGVKVFGFGIGMTAILTLVTPPVAHLGIEYLIAIRAIEGIFEGVTFPCIHAIWARWAPPTERARLATTAFCGSFVGTVVAMPASGFLADDLGWPYIFYVFGGISVVWVIIWFIVVKESPDLDRFISPEELKYIQDSLGHTAKEMRAIKHPWKSILTSPPVWAIVVCHSCENWGFYTMLTMLPTYMIERFDIQISSSGILSGLPYLAIAIVMPIAGQLADYVMTKKHVPTTWVRKIFNCGSFVAQTIFMVSSTYAPTPTGCIVLLVISIASGGFAWCGFSVNHLDIAPQHASVLMGFSNTIATIPGIVSPIVAGVLTNGKNVDQWQTVFFIASGIYLFGAIVYGIWCSGEIQPWARLPNKEGQDQGHANDISDIKEKSIED